MSDMILNDYVKMVGGMYGDFVCSGCDSRTNEKDAGRFELPHSEDCPAREMEVAAFKEWSLEQKAQGNFMNVKFTETEMRENWKGNVSF